MSTARVELYMVLAPPLNGCTGSFGPGLHLVLCEHGAAAERLALLLGGVDAPEQGTVAIGGRDPHRSAAARRQIGLVAGDEPAWPRGTVGAQVAFAAGDDAPSVLAALADAAPSVSANAAAAELSLEQRRGVATALALGRPGLAAVVLVRPLAATAADPDWVVSRVRAVAREAAVLWLSDSPTEVFGGHGGPALEPSTVSVLTAGRLIAADAAASSLARRAPVRVEADDARVLARALLGREPVLHLEWDARRPDEVLVSGADTTDITRAVAEAALAARVGVRAIRSELPSLDEAIRGALQPPFGRSP